MANASSLKGLMTFLRREEWREAFADIRHAHVFVACRNSGVRAEDIADILGQHAAMTLWGCAFEDFLVRAAAVHVQRHHPAEADNDVADGQQRLPRRRHAARDAAHRCGDRCRGLPWRADCGAATCGATRAALAD